MSNPFQNTHAVLSAYAAFLLGLVALDLSDRITVTIMWCMSIPVACFMLKEGLLAAVKVWKNRKEAGVQLASSDVQ